jgi:hypothetical protein
MKIAHKEEFVIEFEINALKDVDMTGIVVLV